MSHDYLLRSDPTSSTKLVHNIIASMD
uniref:Uncharacterized protein n=1 Tax=Arundo donax TaxID=35708 RepID=A0A0A9H7R0_ARUDO